MFFVIVLFGAGELFSSLVNSWKEEKYRVYVINSQAQTSLVLRDANDFSQSETKGLPANISVRLSHLRDRDWESEPARFYFLPLRSGSLRNHSKGGWTLNRL